MRSKLILSIVTILFRVTISFAASPHITAFSPAAGPVGTLITISGTNFNNVNSLTIGTNNAIVISVTGNQIVGLVMPGTPTGTLTLNTANGAATGGQFTVTSTLQPSIQQGLKLTGAGSTSTPQQGHSVAISADGNTAIIGGDLDNNAFGAVWVFTRVNGNWVQQSKLTAAGNIGTNVRFGWSVSLSADGNTAALGAPNDNAFQGAVWIFTHTGNTWQQSVKLVGAGNTGPAYQGTSVDLSADGNTLVEGGLNDNNGTGAIWVFTRSNGTWAQQGNKLTAADNTGAAALGNSIAISADGNTAIAGGYTDNNNMGADWIFVRNNGIWGQQGNKLTGNDGVGITNMGCSVALSADGNTAMIGGYNDNYGQGAAWIFTRAASSWQQQGNKLTGTGGTDDANQGWSVALSADGNSAIVTGMGDNNSAGAMWQYTRNGNNWVQQNSKIIGTGPTGASAYQGGCIALSADGNTAILGALNDNFGIGAAWIFTSPVQTISFAPLAADNYGDSDITPVSVSTNNTIPVTYTSSDNTIATITPAGNIHITGAGTVKITAQQAANVLFNTAIPISQTLTINKASLTVTAANQYGITGQPLPALSLNYLGFVNGDTPANLTALPTASTTAALSSPAGTYPISAGGALSANYTFNYLPGTLTLISSAFITAALPAKNYGDADFYEFGLNVPGVTYISNNPSVAAIVNGSIHITGAGTAVITATSGGHGISKTLTVNKLPLLITANNKFGFVGSPLPVFTLSYSGFVNGDSANGFISQPIVKTTATSSSAMGVYPITVSGGSSANYTFTYSPGVLYFATNDFIFTPIPTKTVGDADFYIFGINTPGITYTSSDPSVATIVNGKIHITGPGTAIITISSGTGQINKTLTVNPAGLITSSISGRSFVMDNIAIEPLVNATLSPNGDGINDVLTINNIEQFPDNKVMIVNRSGIKVFELSGYNNSNKAFNGKSNINGKKLSAGTYYYLLKYKDSGVSKSKTGYIVLKY